MAVHRKPPARFTNSPPRIHLDAPPSQGWLQSDREEERGEAQFAVASAWMNDPSVWEDVYEDTLAKGKNMGPRKNIDRSDARDAIIEALGAGPLRACALKELTGLNGYFSEYMRKLRHEGAVVMPKRGTYALPSEALSVRIAAAGADEDGDGEQLELVEADWLLRLRIIADYEGLPLDDFVGRLLEVYRSSR